MSLISVIVPTKNRPDSLAEALESILNQTYKNLEVIVINDGGKDVSDLLSKFKDKRIRYIQHETSKGPAASRNTGIKASIGKYVAYLDDDDIYYAHHLETLISYLENNDAHFAYSDSFEAFHEKQGNGYVTTSRKLAHGYDFDRQKFLIKDYIPILTVMHRKDCVKDVGMFDESLGVHEDWDLWIRMSGKFDFHHISEVTAEFRTREDGDSITSDNFPKFIKIMKEIHTKYSHVVTDPRIVKTQKAIISLNEARIDQKKMVTLSSINLSDASKDVLNKKITIIIPAQNGSESLSKFIKSANTQKRVGVVEIIVLDEGMSDDTLYMVKESGAKIIRLDPDEFNRGREFNLAVSKSEGDFIVFVGMDALPVSNYWLFHMIAPFFKYPDLSVNTCRNIVRPEADLFNLWINDVRSKSIYFRSDSLSSLAINSDRTAWHLFDTGIKERLICFNRISACVRRKTFDDFQFNTSENVNGMDLEFGINLIEHGKALGYMASTGVYHWNKGSAGQLLRESYVKTLKLRIPVNDLPYFFDINNINMEDLMLSISDLYHFINVLTTRIGDIDSNPLIAVRHFIDEINNNAEISHDTIKGSVDSQIGREDELDVLINEITGGGSLMPVRSLRISENILFPIFMNRFGQFSEYLCKDHQTLDGRQGEFNRSMYNIFAVIAGEVLGAFYLELIDIDKLGSTMTQMHDVLRKDAPLLLTETNKR